MDGRHFDQITRQLAAQRTRRGMFRTIAGGAFAALGLTRAGGEILADGELTECQALCDREYPAGHTRDNCINLGQKGLGPCFESQENVAKVADCDTDNDGIDTTDDDGIETTDDDGVDTTDDDGIDTTDDDGIDTTDGDGIDTTDDDGFETTDDDGIDTTDDDGVDTTDEDGEDTTDGDGIDTTDDDGIDTTDDDGIDTPTNDDDVIVINLDCDPVVVEDTGDSTDSPDDDTDSPDDDSDD